MSIFARVIGFFKVLSSDADKLDALTAGTPAAGVTKKIRVLFAFNAENYRELGLGLFGGNDGILNTACKIVNCDYGFEGNKWYTAWLTGWQDLGSSVIDVFDVGDIVKNYVGKDGEPVDPRIYMNPKDSIAVAALTACIPGIIHGLDKYRQIQCMYADCLQTGVGKQGLPVFACEDQKGYATCKYVVGEVFSVIPLIAVFDYYIGRLKQVLSNPLRIVGLLPGFVCKPTIVVPNTFAYNACALTKVLSFIGETAQEVTSIIDQGAFTIKDDFCDRLEENDDEDEGELFG